MVDLNQLLSLPIFSNAAMTWLIAIAVGSVTFASLLVARRTIRRYHGRFEETGATSFVRIPFQVLAEPLCRSFSFLQCSWVLKS